MRDNNTPLKRTALLVVIAVLLLFGAAACVAPTETLSKAREALNETAQSVQNIVNTANTVAQQAAPTPVAESVASQDASALVAAHEAVLTSVYERVLPSVVHIRVTGSADAALPEGFQFNFPNMPNLPFQMPDLPEGAQPFRQQGEGSGFVWDTDGHIVTNNHVVDGADKVTVVFSDGATADAEVLGADANADLAVIKVDLPASQLTPVDLGDSDALKVGQMAIAIGNPFGLENTMTYGIVSALGRTISSGASQFSIPEVIQTDASINPGNSGGPLLDRQGQVIGINTQIVSDSGSNAGIGFAVPINIAKQVVPSLITTGGYDYAWLGISGQTLTPEVAEAMDLPKDLKGALVIAVNRAGPADKAGLQGSDEQASVDGAEVQVGGDVIVGIDGQTVEGMDDLIAFLTEQARPGDKVELQVVRANGDEETLSVTLGTRPSAAEMQRQLENETQQP